LRKITAKFERDHPLRKQQMQVGWAKIGHFRQGYFVVAEFLLTSASRIPSAIAEPLVALVVAYQLI